MKKCPKCGIEYPDATTLCPADGVALEKSADYLIGTILAGKYRIDERLSEGGMGTVYRGTHVLMDKTVAVKVLRPMLAADEKIVARFSREARAASKISHPNALSVTDFGEAEGGTVFLVMEYLSGRTLKDVIQSEGPMPLGRVIDIMRQVGDALKAAHDQGVVHRDLKSDNIMLIPTSRGEHPMVLDFGIAKIIEPDAEIDIGLTAPNLVIGTPQYMSPEQCSQAAEIDARSDVYSFGVILYEMLVGHVPYGGESPTIVMLKHMQDPVPSVLAERDDLPPSIERIVSRALAKRPEDRYQKITDLLEDLTIAGGIDVPAPAPASQQVVANSQQPLSRKIDDDLDEVTVVRPRPEPPPVPRAPVTVPIAPAAAPAPAATFDPLKILIPSAVALLVVFGLFYAFSGRLTTDANTNSNVSQPTLSPDPSSQPVQAASPPTGSAEQGIPSGGNTNVNKNVNANTSAPSPEEPVPSPEATANENTKPVPTPTLPEPRRTASPVQVPVPAPPQPSPTPTLPNIP
jgi:serine/threonine protein kinase